MAIGGNCELSTAHRRISLVFAFNLFLVGYRMKAESIDSHEALAAFFLRIHCAEAMGSFSRSRYGRKMSCPLGPIWMTRSVHDALFCVCWDGATQTSPEMSTSQGLADANGLADDNL